MDVTSSDEEMDFIRRPPIPIVRLEESEDCRPVTPPMDESLKLGKSLGLMMSPQSPPYRRIRSIKLMESPGTILKPPSLDLPFTSTPCNKNHLRRFPRTPIRIQKLLKSANVDGIDKHHSLGSIPSAYLNPFTPGGRAATDVKVKSRLKRISQRSFTFGSDENIDVELNHELEVKKPRLSDFNVPRYEEEFIELGLIGTGVHGCVYRCLNKLNGLEYAVKRGLKPVNNERAAHNEIYAHGVLEHPNIVRNYSSWTESEYVFMQNEYCSGGSLEEALATGGPIHDEKLLRKILEHIGQGLRFMHSKQLAHMDIKPGNILISKCPRIFLRPCQDCENEYCDEEDLNEETIYKIGDLGHVTRLDEVLDVVEGDCRYLPREILNDDYSSLTKVDIFALGLTLYEAAGGGPLPKNGEEWQAIRDGKLKKFTHLSVEFNDLLKKMTDPVPEARPSANELLSLTSLSPVYKTVKEKHELKAAQQKIQVLEQQLQDVLKCVKVLRTQKKDEKRLSHTTFNNNNNNNNNNKGEESRLVGKKTKRSLSAF